MPSAFRWFVVSLLALAFVAPGRSSADELLPPKVLVRKFPAGQFCALPVSITFTAPSTPIVVKFTAAVWVQDDALGLTWTEQLIDNVSLATTSQVAANTSGPPEFSNSENCYVGDLSPTTYFHFNASGLSIDLLELFDSNPTARGWDLAAGGYYSTLHVGPRNVDSALEPDLNGGALGLGDGSGTPVPGATASASVTIPALTAGQSYDLGAWWYAEYVHFPHDVDYLTISISTLDGTPVARRSWGAVKHSYR
ncbi:MAG: hypothetical protein HOP12_09535, partial [Candidatus Eisenbacteria bacterium]|nr:hypothetical protein [Candidatus Eisenbacteria bacterium]